MEERAFGFDNCFKKYKNREKTEFNTIGDVEALGILGGDKVQQLVMRITSSYLRKYNNIRENFYNIRENYYNLQLIISFGRHHINECPVELKSSLLNVLFFAYKYSNTPS